MDFSSKCAVLTPRMWQPVRVPGTGRWGKGTARRVPRRTKRVVGKDSPHVPLSWVCILFEELIYQTHTQVFK